MLSPEYLSSTVLQELLVKYPSGEVTSHTFKVVPTGYFFDFAFDPFVVIVSSTFPLVSLIANVAPLKVASP